MDTCFFEILAGKSRLLPEKGGVFFYKHPTLFELEMASEIEEVLVMRAKLNGLETEEQLLAGAMSNGIWSEAEEEETKQLKWLIKKQNAALENPKYNSEPSLISELKHNLSQTKKRLEELKIKRESLVSFSLEEYVSNKVQDKMIKRFLFEDEALTQNMDDDCFNMVIEPFSRKLQDLYDLDKTLHRCWSPNMRHMFSLAGDNSLSIFGKTIYDITIFQKNILYLSLVLQRKIENYPDMPEEILENPVKIYNYNSKTKVEEAINIREEAKMRGGVENMKPEDYVT